MVRDWLIVTEQWRVVPGFPAYEISDRGRIRRGGRPISVHVNRNGYMNVSLCNGGRRITRVVHGVVCDAFLGPLPPGMHRSHLNGDKTDNRLANLRIESASANMLRKRGHGSIPRGVASGNAKLTEEQASWAISAVRGGASKASVARKLNVTVSTIWSLVVGRSWSHLQGAA